ncbi:MAG: S-formylglutathione hydrolase [Rhodospirillaceae bacterium]|jgi:S-formylglutathione hydrolase|nr:S-formylglutathione hydrolase [Rhodospirillaceae bacterium]MBT5241079.1 S-formylglutathione hydrolase [Rhodospirillaceae bacterium]MBT5566735.1 S-formylglutathione hydrolase [Rhodospirillaceae bacterium]
MTLETLSEHQSHGGTVGFYRHESEETKCTMQFSVFVPPQAKAGPVPVLTYLAGLTCTEETFMTKAGAHRVAAELGLMLVAPDTSPRGVNVPDDPDGSWDFGLGAGFYLDATEAPYATNYRMYSYVTRELRSLIAAHFPADSKREGVFGHSMGGHGALTIGLKNPDIYRSISAFAPICSPINCPWGGKVLPLYLGLNQETWADYDAATLIHALPKGEAHGRPSLLVDQGMNDQFLEAQLHPHLLENACSEVGMALTLRSHAGYDHGYYFISTFMEDHLRHHAAALT